MSDYSDELDEIIAAASICPECDTLVFAWGSWGVKREDSHWWEFVCPPCGTSFTVPESELVFQSLPTEWLSRKVYAA